ncbi:hypothetical protein B9Z55_027901 [Caenorhabditis nigoni]|nr:hypothetical protein B9Z55_027901 [Caenorhabditis nigoni]
MCKRKMSPEPFRKFFGCFSCLYRTKASDTFIKAVLCSANVSSKLTEWQTSNCTWQTYSMEKVFFKTNPSRNLEG